MISGQIRAYARRPTRIPRCCEPTPILPAYSRTRTLPAGIAWMKGRIDVHEPPHRAPATVEEPPRRRRQARYGPGGRRRPDPGRVAGDARGGAPRATVLARTGAVPAAT